MQAIQIRGASEHNLKSIDLTIPRQAITVITGVSGSGKSSLAFDTIHAEANRRFFNTLSYYSRQFLETSTRPNVLSITGLSPAIALPQNETQPSSRASVGTFLNLSELLGVLLARYGDRHCPKHGHAMSSRSLSDFSESLEATFPDQVVAICAPLVEHKKGHFKQKLSQFAEKGFLHVYIDGETLATSPVKDLNKEERHTIKLIVDYVKIKTQNLKRLTRALEVAQEEGAGFIECFIAEKKKDTIALSLESKITYSSKGGCSECNFSWPNLDARYFSANSLGKCRHCDGWGFIGHEEETDDEEVIVDTICTACQATGIDKNYFAIQFESQHIAQLHKANLDQLLLQCETWRQKTSASNEGKSKVLSEIHSILNRIKGMGLGYLNCSRRLKSLSGGELQRLKLAHILCESLKGVLYVFDEPSQGLHPFDLLNLQKALCSLRDKGNTLILVDHDPFVMNFADLIVDLGPKGGQEGGQVVASFHPSEAHKQAAISRTARHLSEQPSGFQNSKAQAFSNFIELKGVTRNNLKIDAVRFPLCAFSIVSGVSGSGKTSLVVQTLYESLQSASSTPKGCKTISGHEDLDHVAIIDRRPLAKSSVSMPATYLDLLGDIRDLFSQLPEAQLSGFTVKHFSLHTSAGRCEVCMGRGEERIHVRFLEDARVQCQYCHGRRFKDHILQVTYKNHSIANILELTLEECAQVFAHHKKIQKKIRPALDLGLGYLKLGQPSASLSGGEAQRLKLVPYLARTQKNKNLLILDEPTRGLHFDDIQKLIQVLHTLVEQGTTLIMIEHSIEMILACQWIVDLGPGASDKGGRMLYAGPPQGIFKAKESVTAQHLLPVGL